MNKIYTVTAIRIKPESKTIDDFINSQSRCFGWFSSLRKAMGAVLENENDIEERYYNYVVVETSLEGIHGFDIEKRRFWFKWNNSDSTFEECKEPEIAQKILCINHIG